MRAKNETTSGVLTNTEHNVPSRTTEDGATTSAVRRRSSVRHCEKIHDVRPGAVGASRHATALRPRRWLSRPQASKCRSIADDGRRSPGSCGRHGRHPAVGVDQSVVGRQESTLARTTATTASLHGRDAGDLQD